MFAPLYSILDVDILSEWILALVLNRSRGTREVIESEKGKMD